MARSSNQARRPDPGIACTGDAPPAGAACRREAVRFGLAPADIAVRTEPEVFTAHGIGATGPVVRFGDLAPALEHALAAVAAGRAHLVDVVVERA